MRPTTRMEPAIAERFREMLLAGMKQYGIRPRDLADHEHLDGRQVLRFNDERTIDCLCRGEGGKQRQNVVKLYEHAFEAGRSLSQNGRTECFASSMRRRKSLRGELREIRVKMTGFGIWTMRACVSLGVTAIRWSEMRTLQQSVSRTSTRPGISLAR